MAYEEGIWSYKVGVERTSRWDSLEQIQQDRRVGVCRGRVGVQLMHGSEIGDYVWKSSQGLGLEGMEELPLGLENTCWY